MRLLLVPLVLAVAGAVGDIAGASPMPTRTCEERIETGDAPIPFPSARSGSVFAGPLALAGHFPTTPAALGPRHENGRFSTKVGALARAGKPVVLSVPRRFRSTVFTHYPRGGDGRRWFESSPVRRRRPLSRTTDPSGG